MKSTKSRIVGITAVAAALVGGGAAVAGDRLTSKEESDAVVADAAQQLGVEASELDAALKQALSNRIDAAVTAGDLTEAQSAELKERIAAGELPLVGVGPGGKHRGGHHFVDLGAAADYLGITDEALKTSLGEGSTLAEIAEEQGQSVDGLKDALVTAATADIADAVEDGQLTEAQQTELLAGLPDRIDDLLTAERGPRGGHGPRGFGFSGPPPELGDAA